MLSEINYINDIYWEIHKDYIMFIYGTFLYSYFTENTMNLLEQNINIENTHEHVHIEKYLSNDLLMREILSYI